MAVSIESFYDGSVLFSELNNYTELRCKDVKLDNKIA